ncbi:MAG: hypothetical protein HQ518_28725 [Rhodopirellula sp.]|nr:hypothetical protein [Rhodopirellula sp.]
MIQSTSELLPEIRHGVVAKGGRVQIVSLKVLLDKPLRAEEFLKKDDSKSTRSRSSS